MYSEHLNNVHPGWVVGGWLVAVAVTSAVFLVLVGLGLAPSGSGGAGILGGGAVAVGFFVGGLFVGLRWTDAPILHGAAITLLSVVFLFILNLISRRPFDGGALQLQDVGMVLGVILIQLAAAVAGGWVGRRYMLKGGGREEES